jgi:hypothetical protein
MKGINLNRVILGGLAAGLLIWLMEGGSSMLYATDLQLAMTAHSLSMEIGANTIVLSIVVSLIIGCTLVFLYAAVRPRFGPGPQTAACAASSLWAGGYLPSLLGYHMLGLFPVKILVWWGAVGLVEMILAGILGAWLYKES